MNNPKFELTGNDNLDMLLTNINNGADINIQDYIGNTALIIASTTGYPDICKLLLENGANVNIQNKNGFTALINASFNGNIEICKFLINSKSDIDLQDKNGRTALINASLNENINICTLLIKSGANINIPDNNGFRSIDTFKDKGIFSQSETYKILGLHYFKNVFGEYAETYLDVFNTTLYSQEIGLDEIKANIDMFYSNVVARITDNTINENVEL